MLLSLLSIPHANAWCDEDCAYEAHEAAYERASEREYAIEEAVEEGYVPDRRRGERAYRSDRSGSRGRSFSQAEPRGAEAAKRAAEPQPRSAPSADQPRTRIKVATENSSIATGIATGTGTSRIAEDDSGTQAHVQREVGCKTFFASVGMTLSVPCD